jgi:dTDP-glucose 4,6-dehydratase
VTHPVPASAPARHLLITGGAGFIGLNFVHYWHRTHPRDRLVVLDALTYAANENGLDDCMIRLDCTLVSGDICDTALVRELLRQHAIDTVVHFAAESHVDRSIARPDAFIQTNIVGTHILLKAAREAWTATRRPLADFRFHHVSTDEVFGSLEPDDDPFREDTRYHPNSPYAASKAGSDHLVRAYCATYGLPVVGTNCSNNFGPYQHPEKLIPLMLVNALEGRALPVYGDGGNVRDWLWVGDHCRAIDAVVSKGRVGVFYNVGGNNEWTNLALVNLLCDVVDELLHADEALRARFPKAPAAHGAASRDLIRFVGDRPGHDRRYAIDPTFIRGELGFEPRPDFRAALVETARWYLDNEAWWRPVLDGSYREWLRQNYGNR